MDVDNKDLLWAAQRTTQMMKLLKDPLVPAYNTVRSGVCGMQVMHKSYILGLHTDAELE